MSALGMLGLGNLSYKSYDAYATVGLWAGALIFYVIALINYDDPSSGKKQTRFNLLTTFAILLILLGMYFGLRLIS